MKHSASPFFLEELRLVPPDSRTESLLPTVIRPVLEWEMLSCVLIWSWAWRLAMESAKLSFVSAKSLATELVWVSSFGVCETVWAMARKLS